ncbi:MAG: DegT/DnrJ/EryC1/StrS family aminotransferase [Elusimicrobia bacterium]|nr:DegT/DnrJ/EryC1/StrS family aminotransferase [Candidatus Obscuribacterium magneticum]
MNIPLLDLNIKDKSLKDEISQAINSVISSNAFIGGETVDRFAAEFAEACGGGFCSPVANGTDALILGLKALGLGPGDEVITVPYTFIATAEAITAAGASVKYVDIHPKYYTLEPTLLNMAIGPKTKAIIVVHLYGQPADMDPILKVAREHNLNVIEDAAQAHGAEYKGKRVGTLGDVGCFSFYPTKNLGAFGDAGAVVSKSKELIDTVLKLGNHGRSLHYYHDMEGCNSRLDGLQAAVLRAKLKRLDAWNERRRQIATAYSKVLRQSAFITPPEVAPYAKHVFHLYCVETSHRDVLMQYLRDHGIGNGVYYPLPLHLQPAYARLKYDKGSFPVSERLSERILALPMYPDLTNEQVSIVCDLLSKFSPKVVK